MIEPFLFASDAEYPVGNMAVESEVPTDVTEVAVLFLQIPNSSYLGEHLQREKSGVSQEVQQKLKGLM